jgi:hypothetical protein
LQVAHIRHVSLPVELPTVEGSTAPAPIDRDKSAEVFKRLAGELNDTSDDVIFLWGYDLEQPLALIFGLQLAGAISLSDSERRALHLTGIELQQHPLVIAVQEALLPHD